jgi:hypothetical protein
LLDVVDTEENLRLVATILRSSLQQGARQISEIDLLFKRLFVTCKILNSVDVAKETWADPELRISGIVHNNKNTRLTYLTILYDNGLYEELAKDHQCLSSSVPQFNERSILLAALYKIGTPEAFQLAEETVKNADKTHGNNARYNYIFALFACKLGEYGRAYDAVSSRFDKPHFLRTNLKLKVLVEVGRLEEAVLLLRTEMLARGGRPIVVFEVVKHLVGEVKEKCADNQRLVQELDSAVIGLDSVAHIIEESLEETILKPIKPLDSRKAAASKFGGPAGHHGRRQNQLSTRPYDGCGGGATAI